MCVVVLCWIDHVWSKCSFHMFCLCFCMSEVISSFRSLRAGSQVFTLLMLFLHVILYTMSSGKSLLLLCILLFGMLCLSVFNPVAPYRYLLSDMYLFMADITNPDSFV